MHACVFVCVWMSAGEGELGEFITASNEAERGDPFVTDRDSSANGEL